MRPGLHHIGHFTNFWLAVVWWRDISSHRIIAFYIVMLVMPLLVMLPYNLFSNMSYTWVTLLVLNTCLAMNILGVAR